MLNLTPLPSGTVTFLFSDVQGSTRLWDEHPEQMRAALERHDRIIESLTEQHGGRVVKPRGEGDSRFCVFSRAMDAVAAAAAIQQALQEEPWPAPTPIKVRVALHSGEADLREGDYFGSAVNRCARLRATAHGGQTVFSRATHDLVRDRLLPGLAVKDLGEHRLKDLSTPEQIYQLLAPELPAEFPPLLTLNLRPNNLPVQLTSFVGRKRETLEVARLLGGESSGEPSGIRLLTLTGTGGSGKTRLALQVAAGLLECFPDGVWHVELAALSDPSLVPQTVIAAMGLLNTAGRPPLELLTRYLGAKQTLMLLDNCEHLVAASAELADALLRVCPRLQILATSREGLRLAGETIWPVPTLLVPSLADVQIGKSALDALGQYESIKLFSERARAVAPAFELSDQNVVAVAQICQRLDGIPLAIELAAARARLLPVEQLLGRVEDRFRLLTGGSRTALPGNRRCARWWTGAMTSSRTRSASCRSLLAAGRWTRWKRCAPTMAIEVRHPFFVRKKSSISSANCWRNRWS